jgi:hypothetical protein
MLLLLIFLLKADDPLLLFTCCRLSDPSQYQSIVDAEWNIIYDKLDKCAQSGAKIVLSRLAIGDLATQVGVLCILNALIHFQGSKLLILF